MWLCLCKHCYFCLHRKAKVVLETILSARISLLAMPVHSGKNVIETKVVRMIVKFETMSLERLMSHYQTIYSARGHDGITFHKGLDIYVAFRCMKFSIHKHFPFCAAEQFTVYEIPQATPSVLSNRYTYIRSPCNVDTKPAFDKTSPLLKMTCKVQRQLYNQFYNCCINRLKDV